MLTAPTSALPSLPSAASPSVIIGDSSITAVSPSSALADPAITPTAPLSSVRALPTATAATGSIAPATTPLRKKITVSGSDTSIVDGDYYENGEWTAVSPGYPVFTKDDAPFTEYPPVSYMYFNGASVWTLFHFDSAPEINAVWVTTDSPFPLSPELAEYWTPDGAETGELVMTAVMVPGPVLPPRIALPALPTAVAPTPILS